MSESLYEDFRFEEHRPLEGHCWLDWPSKESERSDVRFWSVHKLAVACRPLSTKEIEEWETMAVVSRLICQSVSLGAIVK